MAGLQMMESSSVQTLDKSKTEFNPENKKNSQLVSNPRSTKEARAQRLESLRGMTRLSRKDFADYCAVKPTSFQNWEGPRFGGLTEKAARKIIQGSQILGIQCSLEWLMHGIGQGPRIEELSYLNQRNFVTQQIQEEKNTESHQINENRLITEELMLIHQHYPSALDFKIEDDGMEPFYKKEDYVAGKIDTQMNIHDQDCIVKIRDGAMLVRRVKRSNISDRFTLVCLNPYTVVDQPVIYDAEILLAAPVIWVRRAVKIS